MSRVQIPSPTPLFAMGFNRQLEVFLAIVATLITFVGCIFMIGIPLKASALISICVLVGGLVFGRSFSEVVNKIFSYFA
jgi:uncharacterized membrane protein YphA (DoxX/SURF4 family)